MIDMDLQNYFKFDEADLFANRSGSLTAKQMAQAQSDAKSTGKLGWIGGMIFFAIALLPSLILFLVKANTIFLIIWSVVWIPIWGFIGIKAISWMKPEKEDFILKCALGEVNIVKVERYNSASKSYTHDYELHLGGVTFNVASDLADIMMQGDGYAIYYLEGTKKILSAEKV